MDTRIIGGLLVCSSIASADPPPEDAALHSAVAWGQTVVPDRAALTTQAGYDGAQQRAQATGVVEATIIPRLSVFAGVTYGEETEGASRPAVGAAFQISDPRTHVIGARLSTAYKPEGLSEPEGEVETVLTLSHLVHQEDVVRTFVAFGSDPDGHESDTEIAGGYMHRLADHFVVGGTMRYRYALALKMPGPRWDLVAGAVGDVVVDRWRFELLVGAGSVDRAGSGPLGLVAVGIDL
jgi:hypothetical protein